MEEKVLASNVSRGASKDTRYVLKLLCDTTHQWHPPEQLAISECT